jgi:hypothetical protein
MTPREAAEPAYERALQAQAEADRALQAVGGVAEIGTPEGDRAHELDHAAEVAWERYHDAWHAARDDPEPEAEAEL